MKISTRGTYAIRAAIYLAMHYQVEPLPLSEISSNQEISVKYLETIMRMLSNKGIVTSSKGKGGGFVLSRKPSDITLYDILKATEKSMMPVECAEKEGFCRRTIACSLKEVWKDLGGRIHDYLSKITLQEMAEKERNIRA